MARERGLLKVDIKRAPRTNKWSTVVNPLPVANFCYFLLMAAAFPSTLTTSPALAGTTTVIFGGSDGMGKASARACLLAGSKVILVSRTQAKLDAAKAELLEQTGCDAAMVEVDAVNCLDVDAVEAFFAKHEAGSLTHAVVTLGPAVAGVDKIFTEESTLAKVQEQFFKFNVPWAVAKHGAAKLADGGSLTFFSGTLSRAVAKNASVLGPVNAAIECLGKSLALELAPRLRVNVVSPTLTRTNAVTGGMTPEQQEGMFTGFGKSIPAGRAGEVADIGHAVAFLLTNNFMTGCVLDVDGGKTL